MCRPSSFTMGENGLMPARVACTSEATPGITPRMPYGRTSARHACMSVHTAHARPQTARLTTDKET